MAVTQRSNITYWILTGHQSEYLRVRDQYVDSTLDDTNVSLAYIGHLCSSHKMRHHKAPHQSLLSFLKLAALTFTGGTVHQKALYVHWDVTPLFTERWVLFLLTGETQHLTQYHFMKMSSFKWTVFGWKKTPDCGDTTELTVHRG